MTENSIEKLCLIMNDEKEHVSMRLAAIWELNNRDASDLVNPVTENHLEQILAKRNREAEENLREAFEADIAVPSKIKWAATCIYVTLIFQLIYYAIIYKTFGDIFFNSLVTSGIAIGIAVSILFAHYVRAGKKWPRIVYLVLTVLSIYFVYIGLVSASTLIGRMSNMAYFQIVFIIFQFCLRIGTLVLLFSAEANQFYRSGNTKSTSDSIDQI